MTELLPGRLGQLVHEAANPALPVGSADSIAIHYGEVNLQELRNKLGGDFFIFDRLMKHRSIFTGKSAIISKDQSEGRWFEVKKHNRDDFYQLVQGQDQAELVRASVRPRLTLADYNGGDFFADIDTQGKVTAKNTVFVDPIATDDWLADKVDRPIYIEKKGRKLLINGEKKTGKVHEIQLNDKGEKIYLVKTEDGGWDLVNQQVYEAMSGEEKNLADWKIPVKEFYEKALKPRGAKDIIALAARAAGDSGIPGLWWVGAALMGINMASIGIREIKTWSKIGNFKDYLKQTSFGRLILGNSQIDLNLSGGERLVAGIFGAGFGGAFMLMSELFAKVIPGPGVGRYLINRALLGYILPEFGALLGEHVMAQGYNEAAVKEWLSLTLGVMSTTITAIAAVAFATEIPGMIHVFEQRMAQQQIPVAHAAESPTPTLHPTETATAAVAATAAILPTHTATAVPSTATPEPTHTPEPSPTLE